MERGDPPLIVAPARMCKHRIMSGAALDARARLAVAAGKAVAAVSRRLGRGGSTFPGAVALRLDPGLLGKLARRHPLGNVLVTGTNGKTTTARLLSGMVQAAGFTVAHNRTGANLFRGIAAAFLQATEPGAPRDLGLAEADEATVPRAAREIRPRLVLVTNLFRDQLDRYGELERTAALVRQGLAWLGAGGVAVLNADDPLVASLGEGLGAAVVYFGVEGNGGGQEGDGRDSGLVRVADARYCVSCGRRYAYARVRYAHMGEWACPGCGRRRPRPDVAVLAAHPEGGGMRLRLATPAGEVWARLPLPGLYNAYNAAAAAAAAFALGLPLPAVTQALETAHVSFGRMEVIAARGRELVIALVKNPAGCDQVLRTLLADRAGEKRALIAINDLLADGRDVSWLWDVEFEALAARAGEFAFLGTTGLRAEEMALRLKYAGFPPERVAVEGDLARALDRALAATPEGGRLWLLPTYTALLEARRVLQRRGVARPFWEV